MGQFFVDRSGSLSNVRRTATGGLLVDATLARTGVMEYSNPAHGLVRRNNPATTLLGAMDHIATAPVTRLHPAKFVDVHNYKDLAAGHVVGQPEFRDGHVYATLAIQDAQLIRDIETGAMREVSMGYMAEHDGVAGVTDDGTSFDESRVKIEWNHIAVVPEGRAGKSVRLMLDSEEIPDLNGETMLKIGDKEVAATEAQAAFDSYDADLQAQLATANASVASSAEQVQALSAEVEALKASLVEATSDAAIDAAVAARLAKQEAERLVAEKLARVRAAYPSINLDGRSQDFVDALDLRIELDKKADPSGLGQLDGSAHKDLVVPAPAKKPAYDARAAMREYNRKLSLAPLTDSAE